MATLLGPSLLPSTARGPGFGQVSVGDEAPAVMTPLKPKFYLLGTLTVDAGQAVRLN